MKIVSRSWSPNCFAQVKKPSRKFVLDILFLSETKLNACMPTIMSPKPRFDCFDFIDPVGLSGVFGCLRIEVISNKKNNVQHKNKISLDLNYFNVDPMSLIDKGSAIIAKSSI